MPCSSSAFWTFQHGCAPILTHVFGQRWSLTGAMARAYAPAPRHDAHGRRRAAGDPQSRVAVGARRGAADAQADAVVALRCADPAGELRERARALASPAPSPSSSPPIVIVSIERAEQVGVGVVDVVADERQPAAAAAQAARDAHAEACA